MVEPVDKDIYVDWRWILLAEDEVLCQRGGNCFCIGNSSVVLIVVVIIAPSVKWDWSINIAMIMGIQMQVRKQKLQQQNKSLFCG